MDFYTIFNDRQRAKALDEMTVRLKNGWDLTIHFKEPLINFTQLPAGESEKAFLDDWESNKSTFNKELAQFIEDFGIAALIASATREDSKTSKNDSFKPLVWFSNGNASVDFTFILSVDIRLDEKLVEVKLAQ